MIFSSPCSFPGEQRNTEFLNNVTIKACISDFHFFSLLVSLFTSQPFVNLTFLRPAAFPPSSCSVPGPFTHTVSSSPRGQVEAQQTEMEPCGVRPKDSAPPPPESHFCKKHLIELTSDTHCQWPTELVYAGLAGHSLRSPLPPPPPWSCTGPGSLQTDPPAFWEAEESGRKASH